MLGRILRSASSGRRIEVALLLLALLIALPSLLYPWGGDFAIFDYVAGTVWHGGVPYKDAFDTKPVGMLPIIWLSQTVFGDQVWSIRIMEMCAIAAIGAAVAGAYKHICGDNQANLWGFSALFAASYYHFTFDFWSTAQLELWIALFLTLSLCLLFRPEGRHWTWLLAGVFAGWAFLIKFPACIPAAGIVIVRMAYFARSRSEGWQQQACRILLWYSAGVASIIAVMAVPLIWVLGSKYVYQMWFVFLPYYARTPLFDLKYHSFVVNNWGPHLAVISLLLIGVAKVLRDRRYAALGHPGAIVFLTACAFAAVAVQNKFFSYHHALMLPFLCLLTLWGAAQIRVAIPLWATGLAVMLACFLAGLSTPRYHELLQNISQGSPAKRDLIVKSFGTTFYLEQAAMRINQLKSPGDSLCVGPLNATFLYKLTSLRCTSRFFYQGELFLAAAFDRGRPEAEKLHWADEDRERIKASPPTFVLMEIAPEVAKIFQSRPRFAGIPYSLVYTDQHYALFRLNPSGMTKGSRSDEIP